MSNLFKDNKAQFSDNSFSSVNEALKDASKKVVELNGKERQMFKAVEESVELNDSIFKYMKGKVSRQEVLEELADNEILGQQLKDILNCSEEEFLEIKKSKVNKLRKYLGLSAISIIVFFIGYLTV